MRSKVTVLLRRWRSDHVVTLRKQQLGQVRAVLSGDAGYQGSGHPPSIAVRSGSGKPVPRRSRRR